MFATFEAVQRNKKLNSWGIPYPINFVSNDTYSKRALFDSFGMFSDSKGSDNSYGINFNVDKLNAVGSDQKIANVILHELIHACTVGSLREAESKYNARRRNGFRGEATSLIDEENYPGVAGPLMLIDVYDDVKYDWDDAMD